MNDAQTSTSAIKGPQTSAAGWRRHFGHPTGVVGRIVGHLMAFRNKERSWWVLPQLEINQDDRVLEVGFGSGMDIQRVSQSAVDGFVAGVDHSEVMLNQARRRNRAAIRAGRVDLQLAPASQLPYPDESFDKIFSINVAQFWTDPELPLREMWRVLRLGGLAAVAVQPRSKGATERTARATGQSLLENLRAVGFSEVRLQSKRMKPVSTMCALGVK
jgi:ubiquinone/menaquinone biosynthesis C-methylase UbiE